MFIRFLLVLISVFILSGCTGEKTVGVNGGGYYDIDNKGIGWGLKKEEGKPPQIPSNIETMLAKHNAIYLGDTKSNKIYLTFDEGYENGYTAPILDILKEKNVKATFFITGDYFNRSFDLVKRMVEEGHIIGNHAYYHKNLHKLSDPEKIIEELYLLDNKFNESFGFKMKYMRPPEGQYSERVLAVASDMGYKTVFWSFAYKDWIADERNGAQYALGKIMPFLHGGEIMLLHAVSADNCEALPTVIDKAREAGFEFGTLDDIN